MSYEGGGSIPGPQGATGATGATGGFTFSGPTDSVLWYTGSGVTGNINFRWNQTGGSAYRIIGGPNANYVMFDDYAGNMQIGPGLTGSVEILTPSTLQLSGTTFKATINGSAGLNGQVLTSNGSNTTWQTPSSLVAFGLATCPVDPGSNIYYIQVPDGSFTTSNAIVQTTLQIPDGSTQNWIVDASPYFGSLGAQYIFVEFAATVTNAGTTIAWSILASDSTPTPALLTVPT